MEAFSTLPSAYGMTFSIGISGGDLLIHMQSSFDDAEKIAIFIMWELLVVCVVFFFLLNFLLAIVVDGYQTVKMGITDGPSYTFIDDFIILSRAQVQYTWRRWPHRPAIVHYIKDQFGVNGEILDKEELTPEDLAPMWEGTGKDGAREALLLFSFYVERTPKIASGQLSGRQRRTADSDAAKDAALSEIKEATAKIQQCLSRVCEQQDSLRKENQDQRRDLQRYQDLCELQMQTVQALLAKGLGDDNLKERFTRVSDQYQESKRPVQPSVELHAPMPTSPTIHDILL